MDKYAPENFPSFAFGLDDESNPTETIYGFPRNENGVVKFGFRGIKVCPTVLRGRSWGDDSFCMNKWTNFPENSKISTPITAFTTPSQTALPSTAVSILKRFISRYTPELAELPRKTRLCWYNDSDDNNFMIDYIPNTGEGLFCVCGFSGHGFKVSKCF